VKVQGKNEKCIQSEGTTGPRRAGEQMSSGKSINDSEETGENKENSHQERGKKKEIKKNERETFRADTWCQQPTFTRVNGGLHLQEKERKIRHREKLYMRTICRDIKGSRAQRVLDAKVRKRSSGQRAKDNLETEK